MSAPLGRQQCADLDLNPRKLSGPGIGIGAFKPLPACQEGGKKKAIKYSGSARLPWRQSAGEDERHEQQHHVRQQEEAQTRAEDSETNAT